MIVLKILGILLMVIISLIILVILIIVLLSLVPIGVEISLIDHRLEIFTKAIGKKIQIFPKKNKILNDEKADDKKPEKEIKAKKEKKSKKAHYIPISVDNIFEIIGKIFKGFGKVTHGYNVDRFFFHLIVAGYDPYKTAVAFARINAGMSALAPLCEARFNCKDTDIWTEVDFTKNLFELDFAISIVIRVGRFIALVNTIIFGIVGILIKNKIFLLNLKRTDKDEYLYQKNEIYGFVNNIIVKGKAMDEIEEKENNKNIIPEDERMISNG